MPTSIVKVYNNAYGKWAKGSRVVLAFDASMGGRSSTIYTDENGVAVIDHSSTGMAEVFIDGKSKGKMRTPGSAVFNIN